MLGFRKLSARYYSSNYLLQKQAALKAAGLDQYDATNLLDDTENDILF